MKYMRALPDTFCLCNNYYRGKRHIFFDEILIRNDVLRTNLESRILYPSSR